MTPPNTFTGAALDRAGDRRRDAAWVAAQRADPEARAVVAGRDGVHVEDGRLALVPLGQVAGEPLLLGLDERGPVFAAEQATPDGPVLGLREAAASLPRADGGLAAYAVALLTWHRRHRLAPTAATRRRSARAATSATARAAAPSTTRAPTPS